MTTATNPALVNHKTCLKFDTYDLGEMRRRTKHGLIRILSANFATIPVHKTEQRTNEKGWRTWAGNRVLTNSMKAWLRFAPTLPLVLTTLPKGVPSSTNSSGVQSHGRFRTWITLDGGCVYRNCGCPP
uniref:Uncharacterized protein n=1 Tax=Arundo donax TaxID=35708 RepID=A0A0A9GWK8_ARUDO